MPSYILSPDAQQDLKEIARYTYKRWGKDSFDAYRNGLRKTFNSIGKGNALKRPFLNAFPNLFVTKYRYHFIFYIHENAQKPVIIGVIHEQQDIISRLNKRLS